MRTKEEVEFEYQDSSDRFTLKATPYDSIVRCISINNRKILKQLCDAIGLNLQKVDMQHIYSLDEWAKVTQNGTKCYIYCSMQNFKFIGNSNKYIFATGPVHRNEIVFKDKYNTSNALIALDFILNTNPDFKPEEDSNKKTNTKFQEDEYLYHPAKIQGNAHPPQNPIYDKKTSKYVLKCTLCGQYYSESDVTYTYSKKDGYVYKCRQCAPELFNFKRLTYKEKLAKMSHTDLDEYTFDGRSRE